MAKSKKTKSEIKKDRVAAANKARQTMIDNAIAEHEAKKKLEKANRKKSAKRAAAAKKARQTMIDNAIAEYEAKKNHEKDKAAQTVYHPAKITNDKYTQDLKLSYYSRAGARAQGATALSFALCSLVFTIAYFVLWILVDKNVITGDVVALIKIIYTVCSILMIASTVGLISLTFSILVTLIKERNLTAMCIVSLIFIFVFSVFGLVIFIFVMLNSQNLISWTNEKVGEIFWYIVIASPIVLTIFSGLLFGSIKKHYRKYLY